MNCLRASLDRYNVVESSGKNFNKAVEMSANHIHFKYYAGLLKGAENVPPHRMGHRSKSPQTNPQSGKT
ncbi:hypothetical protein Bbelb_334630, partial [Branchiostoma belcheri]